MGSSFVIKLYSKNLNLPKITFVSVIQLSSFKIITLSEHNIKTEVI